VHNEFSLRQIPLALLTETGNDIDYSVLCAVVFHDIDMPAMGAPESG